MGKRFTRDTPLCRVSDARPVIGGPGARERFLGGRRQPDLADPGRVLPSVRAKRVG